MMMRKGIIGAHNVCGGQRYFHSPAVATLAGIPRGSEYGLVRIYSAMLQYLVLRLCIYYCAIHPATQMPQVRHKLERGVEVALVARGRTVSLLSLTFAEGKIHKL